jgi:subtilisin-like proprotein convertase family protein
MITTDLGGCSAGFSLTTAMNTLVSQGFTDFFNAGLNALNSSCNYTSIFNGTSSAAPVVSGVVALMLDANSLLGWRDVKDILARTARKVDATMPAIVSRMARNNAGNIVAVDPAGYVYDPAWTTNAAGISYNNYYGFGGVDADAAVAAALTHQNLGAFVSTAWAQVVGSPLALAIPDNSTLGVTSSITTAQNLVLEEVQVEVSATHPISGDLAIELTSPGGTKSILLHANNSFTLSGDQDLDQMVLLSNAFYGESSSGVWTLKVLDTFTGDVGTLTDWKIRFHGHAP